MHEPDDIAEISPFLITSPFKLRMLVCGTIGVRITNPWADLFQMVLLHTVVSIP